MFLHSIMHRWSSSQRNHMRHGSKCAQDPVLGGEGSREERRKQLHQENGHAVAAQVEPTGRSEEEEEQPAAAEQHQPCEEKDEATGHEEPVEHT